MGAVFRDFSISRPSRFKVNDDGTITELPGFSYSVTAAQQNQANHSNTIRNAQNQAKQYDQDAKNYPYATISEATNVVSKKQAESLAELKKQYEGGEKQKKVAGQAKRANVATQQPNGMQQKPGEDPVSGRSPWICRRQKIGGFIRAFQSPKRGKTQNPEHRENSQPEASGRKPDEKIRPSQPYVRSTRPPTIQRIDIQGKEPLLTGCIIQASVQTRQPQSSCP